MTTDHNTIRVAISDWESLIDARVFAEQQLIDAEAAAQRWRRRYNGCRRKLIIATAVIAAIAAWKVVEWVM